MTAAFAAAVNAIFADPNVGEAAIWRPGGIGSTRVRIIRKQPDRVAEFASSRAVLPSLLIDIRRSEAATIAEGDLIVVGTGSFRIIAEPIADTLGLVLTCEAERL